ncbi:hypothetical protein CRG98_036948 [Punica granatum]|uniref:Protein rolling stone-like n=1 Tax=Punica granatum TaxID=22663 RepID=A0A2I0IH63_PUNGR|nr:hypothetical protein CRG98_036948 [Punica granatum]
MAEDTSSPSYWLNVTFLLCAIIILLPIFLAGFLVWKYEGFNVLRGENRQSNAGFLHKDEPWRTCLKGIRPAWLLGYRVFAFAVLFSLITTNIVLNGGGIFFFYTQWTFALVTVYFALGSTFSICGCFLYRGQTSGDRANNQNLNSEHGTYAPLSLKEKVDVHDVHEASNNEEKSADSESAGFWSYIFQIVYQTAGGAVILTDSVFWLVLYPFVVSSDYRLNFMDVCLHSLNAVFLLGDALLNDMRFPIFRFAYFILWTCIYVVFQWIIHACISLWWPYPFLDLKTPYAPLWYLGVALWHVPCYGIFTLVVRLKRLWLSRSFPGSYRS